MKEIYTLCNSKLVVCLKKILLCIFFSSNNMIYSSKSVPLYCTRGNQLATKEMITKWYNKWYNLFDSLYWHHSVNKSGERNGSVIIRVVLLKNSHGPDFIHCCVLLALWYVWYHIIWYIISTTKFEISDFYLVWVNELNRYISILIP